MIIRRKIWSLNVRQSGTWTNSKDIHCLYEYHHDHRSHQRYGDFFLSSGWHLGFPERKQWIIMNFYRLKTVSKIIVIRQKKHMFFSSSAVFFIASVQFSTDVSLKQNCRIRSFWGLYRCKKSNADLIMLQQFFFIHLEEFWKCKKAEQICLK